MFFLKNGQVILPAYTGMNILSGKSAIFTDIT